MASKKCVGCDFVAQFSPHDGGYCKEHGDIEPVSGQERHLHLGHGIAPEMSVEDYLIPVVLRKKEIRACISGLGKELCDYDCGRPSDEVWTAEYKALIKRLKKIIGDIDAPDVRGFLVPSKDEGEFDE